MDLQDVLLAAGIVSLIGGVAVIYWPAALILAGLLCFAAVVLIDRAKQKEMNGSSQ